MSRSSPTLPALCAFVLWLGATPAMSVTAFDPAPGAEPLPAELNRQLASVLAEKTAAGYRPRSHHLRPDGTPKYANRLLLTTSPYLLQHAHNPVNWYPWGDEAFAAARAQNRLILLSVGYSTCHWCHVMERESFEDVAIAEVMNQRYIAVKVDREERPDIDAIYMTAVQLLTRRGGWPMTVWLTADGQPVYAGSYFPPRDGDRGVQYGFLTLLQALADKYQQDPQQVSAYGRELAAALRQALSASAERAGIPGPALLDQAVDYYSQRFDPFYGGLDGAPKFPSSLPLRLLLRAHLRDPGAAEDDQRPLAMATLTLEKMAAGGLFDQLGGGFHRYSVDPQWLVPHFEKMLYDNALLSVDYLEAYQLTGREDFAATARRTLDYIAAEMTAAEGGFYSATDADSRNPDGHFEEGFFFTWTAQEIDAALPAEQAHAIHRYYDIQPSGDFEGRNILHRNTDHDDAAVAAELGVSTSELQATLAAARDTLYRARERRPPPPLDDKILTSWNGLTISAFAQAARVLARTDYHRRAARAADFVLTRLRRDGRLLRSYRAGQAQHNAYLDDYAFLIAALLDLFETDGEPRWLSEALALQAVLDKHYLDPAGGYFFTSDDHETLLVRQKPTYDGAEPSGNAVALMNLLRLAEFTSEHRYKAQAENLLRAFAAQLQRAPVNHAAMLLGLAYYHAEPREIVLVAPAGDDDALAPFLAQLRARLVPHKVLIKAVEGERQRRQTELVPLLEGKVARRGAATAYVCQAGICKLPTDDPKVFAAQLTATD